MSPKIDCPIHHNTQNSEQLIHLDLTLDKPHLTQQGNQEARHADFRQQQQNDSSRYMYDTVTQHPRILHIHVHVSHYVCSTKIDKVCSCQEYERGLRCKRVFKSFKRFRTGLQSTAVKRQRQFFRFNS